MIDVTKLSVGDEIVYKGGAPPDTNLTCFTEGTTYKMEGDNNLVCDFCFPHVMTETLAPYFDRFIQKKGGWIAVDLDCTLAVYDRWRGPLDIGAPIPAMVERVKAWLADGRDVRIFTARVTERDKNADGTPHDLTQVRAAIEVWCVKHLGVALPITNVKDWDMMELWDDRAVQVRPNTGVSLADELEAVRTAETAPKYGA